jgi:hypothetical protein
LISWLGLPVDNSLPERVLFRQPSPLFAVQAPQQGTRRDYRLGNIMAKSYYEKLKDPRWQKVRLEIFERDNYTCQKCGSKEKTLNVHHWKYHKDPWNINKNFLITVCEDCHEEIKKAMDWFNDEFIDYFIGKENISDCKSFIGFLGTVLYLTKESFISSEDNEENIRNLMLNCISHLEEVSYINGLNYSKSKTNEN